MNSFTFENEGTNTYLVYKVSERDSLDSMNLGMLTNNKIPGLATTIFTQADTNKYLKYNVSAKISAKQFLSGPVNKKRIIGVFSGIVDAMLSAEDYMISPNTIVLDLEYIFSDVSTCETVMICLPLITDDSPAADLGVFFRDIIFNTQFDQTENCAYVASIINYLNSSPAFSLTDFKTLITQIKNENVENVRENYATKTDMSYKTNNANSRQTVPANTVVNQTPVQPQVQSTPVVSTPQAAKPVQNTVQPQSRVQKPQVQQPPVQQNQVQQTQQPEGKKISMFGLLMHYSKENKELYESQKAAKKAAKQGGAAAVATPRQSEKRSATKKSSSVAKNQGFAIPGQSVPVVNPQQNTQQSINQVVTPQPQKVNPKVTQNVQPVQPVQSVQQVYPQNVTPMGNAANFGETTVLGGGGIGETTVLSAISTEVENKPHLIRTKNNERINLDKPVFRIGKEKSYVDYFVNDNAAVSRSHANIISRDGKYFIVDTNSTNHTYVNGGMIQSNVETQLSHGAKIRLANEDFEFRLY